jgi:CspA family cold shock protein
MGALIWRCRLHTRHWRDQGLEALVPFSVFGLEANERGSMRMVGRVNWFSSDRGFGFITPDQTGHKDCFVHHTAIEAGGIRSLIEGERVEFSVTQGIKGPAAENVTRAKVTSGGADG